MIEQTLKEWQDEMRERFESTEKVAFVCPACGRIATVQDHIDAGGEGADAPKNCIGRTNGKGTRNGKDLGNGCNWAAYGLFRTLGKGRILTFVDGSLDEVFDYPPK